MKMFKIGEKRWINLAAVVSVTESDKYLVLTLPAGQASGNSIHISLNEPVVEKIKAALKLK